MTGGHYISVKDKDEYVVKTNLFEYLPDDCSMISTDTLGMAFEPEQRYEAPDGSDIVFDTDMNGNKREGKVCAGPVIGNEIRFHLS